MTVNSVQMRSMLISGLEWRGYTVYRSPETEIMIVYCVDTDELLKVLPVSAYRAKKGSPIAKLCSIPKNANYSHIGVAVLSNVWLIPKQDIDTCKAIRLGKRYDCYKVELGA